MHISAKEARQKYEDSLDYSMTWIYNSILGACKRGESTVRCLNVSLEQMDRLRNLWYNVYHDPYENMTEISW
jgi:hypothetical protein